MLVSVREVAPAEYGDFNRAYTDAAAALEDRRARMEAAYAMLEHSMTCIGHVPPSPQ